MGPHSGCWVAAALPFETHQMLREGVTVFIPAAASAAEPFTQATVLKTDGDKRVYVDMGGGSEKWVPRADCFIKSPASEGERAITLLPRPLVRVA